MLHLYDFIILGIKATICGVLVIFTFQFSYLAEKEGSALIPTPTAISKPESTVRGGTTPIPTPNEEMPLEITSIPKSSIFAPVSITLPPSESCKIWIPGVWAPKEFWGYSQKYSQSEFEWLPGFWKSVDCTFLSINNN